MNPKESFQRNKCDFPYQIKDMWDIWNETLTEVDFGNLTPESLITNDILKPMPSIRDYMNSDKGGNRNIKVVALVVYGFTLGEVAAAEKVTTSRVRQIIARVIKTHVSELQGLTLCQLRTRRIYVLKALLHN